DFNKGAEKLLGYSAEEMIGKHTPEIIHLPIEVEARGKELSEQYGKQISGFDVFITPALYNEFESRRWTYVRKDGSTFPIQLVVTSIV
ncbi:PAS domain S-box protein, partial [Acinetobacter baumannii]